MIKNIVYLLIVYLLSSCIAKDKFFLNQYSKFEETVYGLKMNGAYSIEKINENSFYLLDTALVAIAYAEETQFEFDFGVNFRNKPIFDLYLRTTPKDFKDNSENIRIEINSQSSKVNIYQGDKILKELSYNFNSELKRFVIKNYEKKIKVSVDCDDIFEYKTELPLTEYLIFRNNTKDSVEISSLTVRK